MTRRSYGSHLSDIKSKNKAHGRGKGKLYQSRSALSRQHATTKSSALDAAAQSPIFGISLRTIILIYLVAQANAKVVRSLTKFIEGASRENPVSLNTMRIYDSLLYLCKDIKEDQSGYCCTTYDSRALWHLKFHYEPVPGADCIASENEPNNVCCYPEEQQKVDLFRQGDRQELAYGKAKYEEIILRCKYHQQLLTEKSLDSPIEHAHVLTNYAEFMHKTKYFLQRYNYLQNLYADAKSVEETIREKPASSPNVLYEMLTIQTVLMSGLVVGLFVVGFMCQRLLNKNPSPINKLTPQLQAWRQTCLRRTDHARFSSITDPDYLCNINLSVPVVPVRLSDRLYDLDAIVRWLDSKHTDPAVTTETVYLCQIQPYRSFFDLALAHQVEESRHVSIR